MVRSLIGWLRFEGKRGLAVLHATDMLDRLAVRGATTKTDLLVVLDVLTIKRNVPPLCSPYACRALHRASQRRTFMRSCFRNL